MSNNYLMSLEIVNYLLDFFKNMSNNYLTIFGNRPLIIGRFPTYPTASKTLHLGVVRNIIIHLIKYKQNNWTTAMPIFILNRIVTPNSTFSSSSTIATNRHSCRCANSRCFLISPAIVAHTSNMRRHSGKGVSSSTG